MSGNNTITHASGSMNLRQVNYASMLNGDAGNVMGPDLAYWSDRSVQVTGTFGTGGTVVIEGSNDGVNFYTLNDLGGAALSITAAGLKGIREPVLFLRPRVTAGDGTTNLAVTFFVRLPSVSPRSA